MYFQKLEIKDVELLISTTIELENKLHLQTIIPQLSSSLLNEYRYSLLLLIFQFSDANKEKN